MPNYPDANVVLSVRELEESDIELIIAYWLEARQPYLEAMGVDIDKVPEREVWLSMLKEQLSQPREEKKSYGIIWLANNRPIGHCNINKIVFAREAYMHLHIWCAEIRKQGWGAELVRMALPWFFENYKLDRLYCEPYALNTAPNRTLHKVGFEWRSGYKTIPGWLNFEQEVNLWELTCERFKQVCNESLKCANGLLDPRGSSRATA